jgi:hypothetical protein
MSQPQRRHVLQLYRFLLRSAKLNMPTRQAQQYMIKRVQEEFRKNKDASPARIQLLLQRAINVLVTSTSKNQSK